MVIGIVEEVVDEVGVVVYGGELGGDKTQIVEIAVDVVNSSNVVVRRGVVHGVGEEVVDRVGVVVCGV